MRQTLALALLILLVSPGAGPRNASKDRGSLGVFSGRDSAVSAAPTPSGFIVPSAVLDPSCNAGHGIRLPTGLNTDAVMASGTMADGSTLIATSVLYPDKSFVVLHSLTRACQPARTFGVDGQARITISPRLMPMHRPSGAVTPDGLWIDAVASRTGGGAIIAGSYKGYWVVGEVTSRGKLDPTFGDGGWIVLPFGGEVVTALQQPSGRILLAGDNGGGGCCTRNWVAALSARGRIETGFGTHGRTELLTAGHSGVRSLAVEANGDILTQVAYGNMGCWGVAVEMLAPSGRPVPAFEKKLGEFWKKLKFGAFVGDVYLDKEGFAVIGTGEPSCDGYHRQPSTGVMARFQRDGTQIGRTMRFASRMYGDIEAFHDAGDTYILASPSGNQTQLTVIALRPDGTVDPRFGKRGRPDIRTPWKGNKAILDTMVSVTDAGRLAATLVATRFGRSSPMHVIRLRFQRGG